MFFHSEYLITAVQDFSHFPAFELVGVHVLRNDSFINFTRIQYVSF